ncbi:methionine aminopeptidase [Cystobacter fuscus]|uniref:Methionine aminopeptidase n=1 Tax=Cystobacter fuscus TaxID=43 RepID=A0A250JD45_9BACT|nr:type I methionyl aminopeptidase [Cystobacter fuscus]ATB41829.1 methionine aminopeptidase [Cystobacter fuscus]
MSSSSITLKTADDIAKMRRVGLIVADVLDAVEAACRPGVSTWELNEVANEVMTKAGATSAFLGYAPHGAPPYPGVLCTSVNEVVVHGIPRKDVILKDGDIIGIDFACYKEGFCADSARSIGIGTISEEARRLIEVTRASLDKAIAACVHGNRLDDIGWAVQSHVEKHGFSVVKEFCGHGIGRFMHESPSVPNFGSPGHGLRLKRGMVLAIEPMVNAGREDIEVLGDGWTAVTQDRRLAAHVEHSVAITGHGPVVLTRR